MALWTQPGFPFRVRGWVGLGQLREIFLAFLLPPLLPLDGCLGGKNLLGRTGWIKLWSGLSCNH